MFNIDDRVYISKLGLCRPSQCHLMTVSCLPNMIIRLFFPPDLVWWSHEQEIGSIQTFKTIKSLLLVVYQFTSLTELLDLHVLRLTGMSILYI